ncbi:hypothetical protein DLD82_03090 [Methanospirillum stamsii]|uniref:PIN domain-containing protein n=1 Tax=Methanospirillum stamsii TaxID=1277351 RepID=A0A2V2N680_9EURY|nr:hypothetical protein DLD82_03090 [Methanospirillum stamsii]
MRSLEGLKEIGRVVLDTNAVIAYRQGIPKICKIIDNSDILYLPVTVLGELLYGALNSTRIVSNEQAIVNFIEYVDIVLIDVAISRRYARIRLNLKKAGSLIMRRKSVSVPLKQRLTGRTWTVQGLKIITSFSVETHLC